MPLRFTCFLLIYLCTACSSADPKAKPVSQKEKIETIRRLHHEVALIPLSKKRALPKYPWEEGHVGNLPKITKEYFRCKGSSLNPAYTIQQNEEEVRVADCGGSSKHSLPLRDQKEFIYPILIEILNYIQAKTGKRVIITSGHRCPEHNFYVNSAKENLYSKHQIGAEVSFYVQGLEQRPEEIVKIIQSYYKGEESEFQRYEKGDTDVSTKPWLNKELFIKIYNKKEGRDLDNCHHYPYIAIQVRYDRDLKEKVSYTWEKEHKNYLRN